MIGRPPFGPTAVEHRSIFVRAGGATLPVVVVKDRLGNRAKYDRDELAS
jgi:hypothetical protein